MTHTSLTHFIYSSLTFIHKKWIEYPLIYTLASNTTRLSQMTVIIKGNRKIYNIFIHTFVSAFFYYICSHLHSFGSIASTSPFGSSVTLEKYTFISNSDTRSDLSVTKCTGDTVSSSIRIQHFHLPLKLNHCAHDQAHPHPVNLNYLVQQIPSCSGYDAELDAVIFLTTSKRKISSNSQLLQRTLIRRDCLAQLL